MDLTWAAGRDGAVPPTGGGVGIKHCQAFKNQLLRQCFYKAPLLKSSLHLGLGHVPDDVFPLCAAVARCAMGSDNLFRGQKPDEAGTGTAAGPALAAATTATAAAAAPAAEGSDGGELLPLDPGAGPAARPGTSLADSLRRDLAQLMAEASDWMEGHRLAVRWAAAAAAVGAPLGMQPGPAALF